jgi:hypothetical protein
MSWRDLLGALAAIAFWAFVFCLMFYLVRKISVDRDTEETVCELPEHSSEPASVPQFGQTPLGAQP